MNENLNWLKMSTEHIIFPNQNQLKRTRPLFSNLSVVPCCVSDNIQTQRNVVLFKVMVHFIWSSVIMMSDRESRMKFVKVT